MTAPKLDPRPARKLTSREVAKILGGVALIAFKNPVSLTPVLIPAEELRPYLRALADAPPLGTSETSGWIEQKADAHVRLEAVAGGLLDVAFFRMLGGFIGTLTEISSPKAVRTALLWWAETDEAWDPETYQ